MPSLTTSLSATVGGLAMSGQITRSGETPLTADVTLPAAKTGTLTTRTSGTAGVVTAQAGHGFITGDVIDVYSAATLTTSMTATVSGNAITLASGTGDALPIATTAVILSKRVIIEQGFDGDLVKTLLIGMSKQGSVRVQASGGTVLSANLLANEMWSWFSGMGVTNPLAATDVLSIHCSNAVSSSSNIIRVGMLLDTVPSL